MNAPPSSGPPLSSLAVDITSRSSSHPLHLIHLPSNVLLYSILPFLPLRHKLLDLNRLSHSFPTLTPACFRHDHLELNIGRIRRACSQWSSESLSLVSSVESLWVESSLDDEAQSEAERAELISFDLTCISLFHSVVAVRLPWPDLSRTHGDVGYIHQQLASSTPSFTQLQSLCVRVPSLSSSLLPLSDVQALCSLPSLTQLSLRQFDMDPLCCQLLLCAMPSLVLLDLHECWWAKSYYPVPDVSLPRLVSPSPSLRTLILPARGYRHPELDGLLSVALQTLTHLDVGTVDVCAAVAKVRSSPLITLHLDFSPSAGAILHNLHCDRVPRLSQLRYVSSKRSRHAQATDGPLYTSFVQSYCAQLQSVALDLSRHGGRINDVLDAVFSCSGLRTLSLHMVALHMDTVTAADGTPVLLSRPSPLSKLHTLGLNLTQGGPGNADYDTVSGVLSTCPSLHHITLTYPSLPIARLVALAGRLCPQLETLWIMGRSKHVPLPLEEEVLPRLSRPLFPSLQAAFIVPNLRMPSHAEQPLQRAAESLRWIETMVPLLAAECAPVLKHLYLRPRGNEPLDTALLPLLRPLTSLRTLGGVVRGADRPSSWLPYRWPVSADPLLDTMEARQVRMQQLFTQNVRVDAKVTVSEVVHRLVEYSTRLCTSLLHFVDARARESFYESINLCLPVEQTPPVTPSASSDE